MRFSHSDEQEEFRRVVRRFLEDHSQKTEVRRLMDTPEGCDPGVWKQLSGDLGLTAIHIPEEFGGQGYTFEELCIALQEMGRALLCAPYFASVALAANAILNAATEAQKKELLPAIASGESVATLALSEAGGSWDASGVSLIARPVDGGFELDGAKTYVLDGHTADLIVVVARSAGSSGEDGISLFTTRGDAPGLERRQLSTVDETRKQAELVFSGVSAERLGEPETGAKALARTLDLAAIALSNEMVGGAQMVLEMSVDYAKTRVQFGRPIGSFQAIKHKCADMLLDVELAKSAASYAAAAASEGDEELPTLAPLAKALAADAFRRAAADCIQIHGGIGFTWEHDAHLYFKRAKSSEVLLGDPTYHRELLAERMKI
ncbi:MAG: acyl-CoA dehydrogenase family protein [Myxococcota bacterium]